jgi:hypothetical protein
VRRPTAALILLACIGLLSPERCFAWLDSLGNTVTLGKVPEIDAVSPDGKWKLVNLAFHWEHRDSTGKLSPANFGIIDIVEAGPPVVPEAFFNARYYGKAARWALSGHVRKALWTKDSKYCVVTFNGLHQPYNISMGVLSADGSDARSIPNEFVCGHLSPFFDLSGTDQISFRIYKDVPWGSVEGGGEPGPDDFGTPVSWSVHDLLRQLAQIRH